LTGIMDSLLGDSLLLDGQAVYQPSDLDPGALLRDVCQLHRETTRGADIREDFAELPLMVRGDPKLLFALFSNLLSNAIKYSGPGGPVEIIARGERSESWMVQVRDHGMGIPERDRAHLFERYFRGAGAVGVAGSGVGLHLVAMVLELHGGTIEVESSEGVGSSFAVRLPAAAVTG
jgi:signal transduction histidine kinase